MAISLGIYPIFRQTHINFACSYISAQSGPAVPTCRISTAQSGQHVVFHRFKKGVCWTSVSTIFHHFRKWASGFLKTVSSFVPLVSSSLAMTLAGAFNNLEKHESQWEELSHILWKIKNAPNHQHPPTSIYRCLRSTHKACNDRSLHVKGRSTVRLLTQSTKH